MNESLPDALLKAADALHWLGQYQIANACILFSRLARALELHSLDDLEVFVSAHEADAAEEKKT